MCFVNYQGNRLEMAENNLYLFKLLLLLLQKNQEKSKKMEEKKKAEEQQQREEVIAALKEGKKPYIPKKCNLFCICKMYFILFL